jgi:hypothetical protein
MESTMITAEMQMEMAIEEFNSNYRRITSKEAYKLCKLHDSNLFKLKSEPLLLKTGAKLRRETYGPTRTKGFYYITGYGGNQLKKALELIK